MIKCIPLGRGTEWEGAGWQQGALTGRQPINIIAIIYGSVFEGVFLWGLVCGVL